MQGHSRVRSRAGTSMCEQLSLRFLLENLIFRAIFLRGWPYTRLFHVIWASSTGQLDQDVFVDVRQLSPEERLRSLSSADRAALLLTAVEGFSLSEAGKILGKHPRKWSNRSSRPSTPSNGSSPRACSLSRTSRLLPSISRIWWPSSGHKVVGNRSIQDEAVNKARSQQPGLVLADINLGRGRFGHRCRHRNSSKLRYSGHFRHGLSRAAFKPVSGLNPLIS